MELSTSHPYSFGESLQREAGVVPLCFNSAADQGVICGWTPSVVPFGRLVGCQSGVWLLNTRSGFGYTGKGKAFAGSHIS